MNNLSIISSRTEAGEEIIVFCGLKEIDENISTLSKISLCATEIVKTKDGLALVRNSAKENSSRLSHDELYLEAGEYFNGLGVKKIPGPISFHQNIKS